MTSKDVLLWVGGITVTTVIATLVIIELKKNANKKTRSNTDVIETMEFSISDLNQWVAKNNPDLKNKICVLTLESLKKKDSKITNVIKAYIKEMPKNSNCLFLVSFDSNQNIKKLDIVIYDHLGETLKKLLDKSDGIFIMEE